MCVAGMFKVFFVVYFLSILSVCIVKYSICVQGIYGTYFYGLRKKCPILTLGLIQDSVRSLFVG